MFLLYQLGLRPQLYLQIKLNTQSNAENEKSMPRKKTEAAGLEAQTLLCYPALKREIVFLGLSWPSTIQRNSFYIKNHKQSKTTWPLPGAGCLRFRGGQRGVRQANCRSGKSVLETKRDNWLANGSTWRKGSQRLNLTPSASFSGRFYSGPHEKSPDIKSPTAEKSF